MAMLGESSRTSLTAPGSVAKALFGGVSLEVVEVTHAGALPLATVDVQPAGKAGAVTPSKFSEKATLGAPSGKVNGMAPRLVVPSCKLSVAVSEPPQLSAGFTVKVKDRVAPAPPAVRTP